LSSVLREWDHSRTTVMRSQGSMSKTKIVRTVWGRAATGAYYDINICFIFDSTSVCMCKIIQRKTMKLEKVWT